MGRSLWGKGLMVMVLAVLVLLPGLGKAAEFDVSNFDKEVGLRFGYGKNTHGASVNIYSLLPRWGMFLRAPGKEWGPFGASFVIEGIISVASAEEVGFELGFTPMVKFTCLLFPSVMAFIEGGAGMITESINSPAIAHAFNFTPQFGGGFDIALTPKMALSLAYRFRHSSNAGIYKENQAFNVNFAQAGLTYYY